MSSAVDTVFELPFSRDMESEADEVGMWLASTACYDIRQAPFFWGKFAICLLIWS